MRDTDNKVQSLSIPDGFVLFISGVPGVGKTTISYELLKKISAFRIIEETDLIREILLGYNEYLKKEFNNQKTSSVLNEINIADHMQLLSYDDAKMQCLIMKKSIEQIIRRQQRKGIATIINGVHIVPEILYDISPNNGVFLNLYVTDKQVIKNRIYNRNPSSYMLDNIPFIFQTNNELFSNTDKLVSTNFISNIFNINVTNYNIKDTVETCILYLKKYVDKLK